MEFQIIEAEFIVKHNRFLCEVKIAECVHLCHIPNTGRLKELLTPGNRVGVRHVGREGRKTNYELLLAEKAGIWYSVDSRMPNALIKEWAASELIPEWTGSILTGEKTFEHSRFDFRLEGDLCGYVEVKGVTLEREGVGYFPDAPTERGRKHLAELLKVKAGGLYAAVAFVCTAASIEAFMPNDGTDPEFGALLRQLRDQGVAIFAFQAQVRSDGVAFGKRIPVIL